MALLPVPLIAQIENGGEHGHGGVVVTTTPSDPPTPHLCPYFKWQSKMVGLKNWTNIFTGVSDSRQTFYIGMWKEFFEENNLQWSKVEAPVNAILKAKDKIVYECSDGADNDGDGAVDTKDIDCARTFDATESGSATECNDGVDNDGDGGVDYLGGGGKPADLSCISSQIKKESDGTPRLCQNKKDDDGDGLIDATDPGCSDPQDNQENDGTTHCQDGIDNDGDGAVDSLDPGCFDAKGKYQKIMNSEGADKKPECSDGLDNDGDGRIDWQGDFNCTGALDNQEAGPLPLCANTKDDDKDGKIDAEDPDCANRGDNSEAGGPKGTALPACSDGADNDGDGARDYPADKGCANAKDTDEGDAQSVCQNGIDDDGDGFIDYPADLGCASTQGATEAATKQQCQNGKDDDGDGLKDMADPGCSNANDNTENSATTACQDGRDNDGDGAVDFPADFGCSSKLDTNEGDVLAQCQNGQDDDGDGAIDYPADLGCSGPQGNFEKNPDPKKRLQCENGIDDDKDGFIDMGDPACDSPNDNQEAGITEQAKEAEIGKYLTDYVKALAALPLSQSGLTVDQRAAIIAALDDTVEQAEGVGTCYGADLARAREFARITTTCSGNANRYDDGMLVYFYLGVEAERAKRIKKYKSGDNGACFNLGLKFLEGPDKRGYIGSPLAAKGTWIKNGAINELVFYFDANCNPVDPSTIQTLNPNCEAALRGEYTFRWYGSPISLIWSDAAEEGIPTPTLVNFPLALDKVGAYWVWRASAAAPLLVYDPEHKGRITSAAQLFGHWTFGGQRLASLTTGTAQQWPHGYAALATQDSDGNGEISGKELRDLGLWFDENQNGISEPGEVKTLAASGVTHLYLPQNATYDPSRDIEVIRGYRREVDGREIFGKSIDWTARGNAGAAAIMGAGVAGATTSPSYAKEVESDASIFEPSPEVLKEIERRFSGAWQWKIESVAGLNPQLGGMFLFNTTEDGQREGFTMTDAALGGASTIRRMGLRSNFTWTVTQNNQIEFEVVKTPSIRIRNTARISADGKTLEGETIGEERGQPTLKYRWVASKEVLK